MTDESLFVDAYSLTTRAKQRIPRHWLEDPVLGRDFAKTPSQRELDGELPPRPPGDAKAKEIEAFAEAAAIDLTGAKSNADKLVVIEDALGSMGSGPVQVGVVETEPPAVVDDPLAPDKVALVDTPIPSDDSASSSADSTTNTEGDTESSDETPAAGDEEN